MTILVQKRQSSWQPGGCGGWILGGYEKLETLDNPPEEGWETYLRRKYEFGQFRVSQCCGNKNIKTLFSGSVGIL